MSTSVLSRVYVQSPVDESKVKTPYVPRRSPAVRAGNTCSLLSVSLTVSVAPTWVVASSSVNEPVLVPLIVAHALYDSVQIAMAVWALRGR